MGSLDGKVALVTGAGRGLGRACAHLFARDGACVVVAEINEETGQPTGRSASFLGVEFQALRYSDLIHQK